MCLAVVKKLSKLSLPLSFSGSPNLRTRPPPRRESSLVCIVLQYIVAVGRCVGVLYETSYICTGVVVVVSETSFIFMAVHFIV